MEASVKANTKTAQAKQKKYYDAKFGAASSFGIGIVAFMKDLTRKRDREESWTVDDSGHTLSPELWAKACMS